MNLFNIISVGRKKTRFPISVWHSQSLPSKGTLVVTFPHQLYNTLGRISFFMLYATLYLPSAWNSTRHVYKYTYIEYTRIQLQFVRNIYIFYQFYLKLILQIHKFHSTIKKYSLKFSMHSFTLSILFFKINLPNPNFLCSYAISLTISSIGRSEKKYSKFIKNLIVLKLISKRDAQPRIEYFSTLSRVRSERWEYTCMRVGNLARHKYP